jgi:hypothetical protein
MTTTTARPRSRAAAAPHAAADPRDLPERHSPILTRAETAECTCPDACERDHERD